MGKKRTLKTRKKKINRRKKTAKVKKGGGRGNPFKSSKNPLQNIQKLFEEYKKLKILVDNEKQKQKPSKEIKTNVNITFSANKKKLDKTKKEILKKINMFGELLTIGEINEQLTEIGETDYNLNQNIIRVINRYLTNDTYQKHKIYIYSKISGMYNSNPKDHFYHYYVFIPLKSISIEDEKVILDILYEIYDNNLLYINTQEQFIKLYKPQNENENENEKGFGIEPENFTATSTSNPNPAPTAPQINSSSSQYGF
jgi:hypothetical protein